MAFKMKGFPMIQGTSPAKNYKNPQDYKVFNMGNKPDGPFKQKHDDKAKTGHGAKDGPDVYYTKDGKSKQVAYIDEEYLENKVRRDLVFGKYVVHTNPDTGKKTKYYFKNPKKAPDQSKFSDLEKHDDDKN